MWSPTWVPWREVLWVPYNPRVEDKREREREETVEGKTKRCILQGAFEGQFFLDFCLLVFWGLWVIFLIFMDLTRRFWMVLDGLFVFTDENQWKSFPNLGKPSKNHSDAVPEPLSPISSPILYSNPFYYIILSILWVRMHLFLLLSTALHTIADW